MGQGAGQRWRKKHWEGMGKKSEENRKKDGEQVNEKDKTRIYCERKTGTGRNTMTEEKGTGREDKVKDGGKSRQGVQHTEGKMLGRTAGEIDGEG